MPGPFADEELAAFVSAMPPPGALDVAAMRDGSAQRARQRTRGPQMHAVSELRIGQIAARLYRPVDGRTPLVVYMHGGGWTLGGLEGQDWVCRRLADGAADRIAAGLRTHLHAR